MLGGRSCPFFCYGKIIEFPHVHAETFKKSLGSTSRSSTFSLQSHFKIFCLAPKSYKDSIRVSLNKYLLGTHRSFIVSCFDCMGITDNILPSFVAGTHGFWFKNATFFLILVLISFQIESSEIFDRLSIT